VDGWPGNPHAMSFNRKTCWNCERRGWAEAPPLYCSVACKTEARRQRRTEARRQRRAEAREPKKPIKCAECGERFTPIRSTARFCSTPADELFFGAGLSDTGQRPGRIVASLRAARGIDIADTPLVCE
jgi:hypothetical protein